jgi:hypothetical protein
MSARQRQIANLSVQYEFFGKANKWLCADRLAAYPAGQL